MLPADRSGDTAPVPERGHDAGLTVRDQVWALLREQGLTRIFGNPGSTEIPLLTGLPDDIDFVLALHEASVVGMATGWALARRRPALALVHTAAGLGNAVGAIATARVNRAPVVVIVGQQDRRHLALTPFLAGRLRGLAGDYPVWVDQPVRAADVPGALLRAVWEAQTARGPALVIVPMDDWSAPASTLDPTAAPRRMVRADAADGPAVDALAEFLGGAQSPVMIAGAGLDDEPSWSGAVALAERLRCPVWQEAFGARAGFPQDHAQFAGFLPADRDGVREALAGHDGVLAVGAPVLRQYPYRPGGLVPSGARVAMLGDDPAEVHGSAADLAVLAAPGPTCAALAARVPQRSAAAAIPDWRLPAPPPVEPGEPMRAGHVLAALADRLPAGAVVIEEAPSNRRELNARLPARHPLGNLSAAMGGLGFAIPAAVGVRMALAETPVVAIVGDGSSLYSNQALWTAAHERVGVVVVVLNNGGYAIMNHLAREAGGASPWPEVEVDFASLAGAFGCAWRRMTTPAEVAAVLDEELAAAGERQTPVLLEAVVTPDPVITP